MLMQRGGQTPRRSGSNGRQAHRHARQHRIARERVAQAVVEPRVEVHARPPGRDREPRAGLVVAPAVRQADDAGHHRFAQFHGHLDPTLRARLATAAPASVGELSWDTVIDRFAADLAEAADEFNGRRTAGTRLSTLSSQLSTGTP